MCYKSLSKDFSFKKSESYKTIFKFALYKHDFIA